MRENFTISIANSYNFSYLWNIIISIIIAAVIMEFYYYQTTHSYMPIVSIPSVLSLILLSLIIYIILLSITSENLSNELPSTLYPSLPHNGLDGISLNSYVAGMNTSKFI